MFICINISGRNKCKAIEWDKGVGNEKQGCLNAAVNTKNTVEEKRKYKTVDRKLYTCMYKSVKDIRVKQLSSHREARSS